MSQVKAYWNLHRECWSVMDAKTRRVIRHATHLVLRDASFSVSETGRQRVIATRRKAVHAFACGEVVPGALVVTPEARKVRYNPYETPFFTFADSGEEARGFYKTLLLTPEGEVYVIDIPVARVTYP